MLNGTFCSRPALIIIIYAVRAVPNTPYEIRHSIDLPKRSASSALRTYMFCDKTRCSLLNFYNQNHFFADEKYYSIITNI